MRHSAENTTKDREEAFPRAFRKKHTRNSGTVAAVSHIKKKCASRGSAREKREGIRARLGACCCSSPPTPGKACGMLGWYTPWGELQHVALNDSAGVEAIAGRKW